METNVAFDPHQAAAVVVRELLGSTAKVKSVKKWGIGALNACYRVATTWQARVFFIKFENECILPTTRRGQIEREVNGIRLALAAGIDVPEVLAYDFSPDRAGRKYLVEAFIEGELFWEMRESLGEANWQALQADIEELLARMRGITSPVFGDLYPGGVVGQHAEWSAAYTRMAEILLADTRALELFSPDEEQLVQTALVRGAQVERPNQAASLYHGDLGLHNLMADCSSGSPRLSKLIDFGNAFFAPQYANEDGVRAHGGFGLDPLDAQAKYGVSKAAQAADNLLLWFEQVVFFANLQKNHGWTPHFPFREQFLKDCAEAE